MTIDKASMLVALLALAPRGAAAAEPTLTVSDSVVAEGDADSTLAVFTVSLSGGDPGQPVTVRWATEDLTASGLPAGRRSERTDAVRADYEPRSGTLVFPPGGPGSRHVYVTIYGDTEAEGSEVFLVRLTGAEGAVIAKDVGHGVIKERDFTPAGVKCDADGDGASDLFVDYSLLGGDGAGQIPYDHKDSHVVWITQATTAFPRDVLTGSHPWHLVATDDFNGDRICDLVWEHGETLAFAITPPDGHFRPPKPGDDSAARPGPEWTLVGAGDFSGAKGEAELLWWNRATGELEVWTFLSPRPPAGLVRIPIVGRPPDSSWQPAGVADLDGDGFADILWRNESSGSVEYWRMVGLHRAGTIPLGPANSDVDMTWRLVAVGDFNGDGVDDLLWEQPLESAAAGFAVADEPTRRIKIWLSSRGVPEMVEGPFSPRRFDVESLSLQDGSVVGPR